MLCRKFSRRHSFSTGSVCLLMWAALFSPSVPFETARAETQSPAKNTAVTGLPRIVVSDPVYDFGTVRQGTTVQHEFTLSNSGAANLKIERMHTSCGCTAAVIESDTIAPGKSTQVRVTFDTSGFQGAKMKSVRLYSNDAKQPSVVLTVQGTVQPDVEISVARVHFGDIRHGQTPSLKFTVSARSELGIKVEDAVSRSPHIELASEDFSADGRAGKRITIRLKDSIPVGLFRDRIVVRTSSGNNPVMNIPVIARVQGDLRLDPTIVSFGLIDAKSQSEISKIVRVEFAPGSSGKIVSVDSDNSSVVGETTQLKDGKGVGIKVTVKPDITGAFRARLKITTDNADPDQRQLYLPVYGIVGRFGPS